MRKGTGRSGNEWFIPTHLIIRTMARKSKEQIRSGQAKNEKEINDIFQNVSCFWGIDRVEITNLSIVDIDSDLLAEQRLLLKSKVKYSVEKDSVTGMMKYTRIEIKDIGGVPSVCGGMIPGYYRQDFAKCRTLRMRRDDSQLLTLTRL